jgi:hypothetical protein
VGFFSRFSSAPQPVGLHGNTGELPKLAEGVRGVLDKRIAILESAPSYEALRAVHFVLKSQIAVQAAFAPAEKSWSQALWWGAMASEALLACAKPSTFEVYFRAEVSVPPASEPAPALARIWREGYQMALLSRYDEVAAGLQRFNLSWLRERDREGTEAELLYAHALQGLVAKADDLDKRLSAAVTQIVQPNAEDSILRLLGAEAECLYALLIRDASEFNRSLTSGLAEHRKYWTRSDRATNPEGLFALGLSYVARLARDAGMSIGARSPYLVYA